ncbi:undecaprenyl/decaprenyl-phosphate alpha-N-acetylglucosaminyl 1-phosphate transferase [Polaribacter litorisediminis]|uniref:glycosyltransferase family 4 protein n=1 Tax=Polaribacter litorisediminis TaxID=1908341 RepID=UPI001CBE86EF|nr:MraY family glycosyltransferase [Polaribacter litorisediminis]UAM97214.1 undecaprenyl/decaprenyl-phosphate alpha-N-acetylglucosaminyl 1-phosphate transferase [Polaribacter litorisediminis]
MESFIQRLTFDNLYVISILSLIGSFIMVTILIPKIREILHSRDLVDLPPERSSHKISTPTMAGVSFFLTISFAFIFIKNWDVDGIGINLLGALALMFAVGLKDDLVISAPRAKVGAELIAISFVIFCACYKITSLEGFLGIEGIPPIVSYILVTIVMLTIINSYNLIDGIDGLASVIGIAIFSIYAFLFYAAGIYFYFLFCLSLIGILLAYLRYNVSLTKKIFMGDTGSLIMGFCIAVFSLKFLTMDISLLSEYSFVAENKLIVISGIFFIPGFDTLRVIGVRLLKKSSPFYPDRNHIHHILIDSGLTHFKASLFLCCLNFLIAVSIIYMSTYFNSFQMLGISIFYFIFFLGLFYKLKANIGKKNSFKHLISAIQILF